jgi:hypothetical protein
MTWAEKVLTAANQRVNIAYNAVSPNFPIPSEARQTHLVMGRDWMASAVGLNPQSAKLSARA